MSKKPSTAEKLVDALEIVREISKSSLTETVIRFGTPTEQRQYAIRPLQLITLTEAEDALLCSSFIWKDNNFREWIKARVAEYLKAGHSFILDDLAEYRLATQQEVIDAAGKGLTVKTLKEWAVKDPGATDHADDPARPGRVAKPVGVRTAARREEFFSFTIPPPGKARDKAFADLTTQGRQLLEIIAETGQERLNVAAVETVLNNGRASKGIDPKIPLLQRFKRFHTTGAYEKLVKKED